MSASPRSRRPLPRAERFREEAGWAQVLELHNGDRGERVAVRVARRRGARKSLGAPEDDARAVKADGGPSLLLQRGRGGNALLLTPLSSSSPLSQGMARVQVEEKRLFWTTLYAMARAQILAATCAALRFPLDPSTPPSFCLTPLRPLHPPSAPPPPAAGHLGVLRACFLNQILFGVPASRHHGVRAWADQRDGLHQEQQGRQGGHQQRDDVHHHPEHRGRVQQPLRPGRRGRAGGAVRARTAWGVGGEQAEGRAAGVAAACFAVTGGGGLWPGGAQGARSRAVAWERRRPFSSPDCCSPADKAITFTARQGRGGRGRERGAASGGASRAASALAAAAGRWLTWLGSLPRRRITSGHCGRPRRAGAPGHAARSELCPARSADWRRARLQAVAAGAGSALPLAEEAGVSLTERRPRGDRRGTRKSRSQGGGGEHKGRNGWRRARLVG